MLPRKNIEQLLESPAVLSEIIANISTETFLEMFANAQVDQPHPLDNEEILKGLASRKDIGKLLVAARYAHFDDFPNTDLMLTIANTSFAHKCALLANSRARWDSVFVSNRGANALLLKQSLLADDASTRAFLGNPRANRRLIADAIRGKEGFSQLSLETRLRYGYEALRVDYIDSPNYPGKDSPDSNEMDFDKPREAFLAVLREVLDDPSKDARDAIAADAFSRLTGRGAGSGKYRERNSFSIDYDDWLTPDDKASTDVIPDWRTRYGEKKTLAIKRLTEWAIRLAEYAEPSPREAEVGFAGGLGSLAIYLSLRGIRDYDLTSSYYPTTKPIKDKAGATPTCSMADQLRDSRNWTARAAALAATFEAQVINENAAAKRIALAQQLIESQSKDVVTCIRGLATSRIFWGLFNSSDEVSSAFSRLRTSPEAERTYAYVMEYMGDYQFGDEIDQIVQRHKGKSLDGSRERDGADNYDAGMIRELNGKLTALAGKVKSLQSWVSWGLVIIGGLILFR